MANRDYTVIGSYSTRDEAMQEVRRLVDQGYSKNEITLYTNKDTADSFGTTDGVDVTSPSSTSPDTADRRDATGSNDDSLWDQIKNAFSTESRDDDYYNDPNYNKEEDFLHPYRNEISEGNIVVAVTNYRGTNTTNSNETTTKTDPVVDNTTRTAGTLGTTAGFPNTGADDVTGMTPGAGVTPPATGAVDPGLSDTTASDDVTTDRTDNTVPPSVNADTDDDDETIRLKEERLQVDKDEVKAGEVDVHKNVVHDTETVEVPVEHEEVVIERKPATDDGLSSDKNIDENGETINIPIKEEKVDVSKHSVVNEEVEVRKEKRTDTERVSEDVRHEELDVDTEGDVHVEGDRDLDDDNDLRK